MNQKFKKWSISVLVFLIFGTAIFAVLPTKTEATCTGSKSCKACKSCKSCGHCAKNGGTCGVCK